MLLLWKFHYKRIKKIIYLTSIFTLTTNFNSTFLIFRQQPLFYFEIAKANTCKSITECASFQWVSSSLIVGELYEVTLEDLY